METAHRRRDPLDRAYAFLVEDGDVRVCADIPDEACTDVPGNFFRIGASQVLTKLADEMASAKTVLPWVLTSMGAPSVLIGFLVPIRESGSLLPQLAIAEFVRRRPRRKRVWILGALLQATALAGIAASALHLGGWAGGAAVVTLLLFFSLARGLVSVASKDVTGKTVPKTRRGRLTGFTTAASGLLTMAGGGLLALLLSEDPPPGVLALVLLASVVLWLAAASVFAGIREIPGATEGGKNAFGEALRRLEILRTDVPFRHFVLVRSLLVSTGLAAPYYVALAREHSGAANLLALFLVGSGLASALSSAFWGRFADRSSRSVLMAAAGGASLLGAVVFLLDLGGAMEALPWIAPLAFFLLAIAHSGVRIGRKTYILDMAGGARRTDYVAVSNTVIGVVLLLTGALGLLTPLIGPRGMLLLLAAMGLAGVWWGRTLPEVQKG